MNDQAKIIISNQVRLKPVSIAEIERNLEGKKMVQRDKGIHIIYHPNFKNLVLWKTKNEILKDALDFLIKGEFVLLEKCEIQTYEKDGIVPRLERTENERDQINEKWFSVKIKANYKKISKTGIKKFESSVETPIEYLDNQLKNENVWIIVFFNKDSTTSIKIKQIITKYFPKNKHLEDIEYEVIKNDDFTIIFFSNQKIAPKVFWSELDTEIPSQAMFFPFGSSKEEDVINLHNWIFEEIRKVTSEYNLKINQFNQNSGIF
jgi:hypothetical protein